MGHLGSDGRQRVVVPGVPDRRRAVEEEKAGEGV